MQGEKRPDAPKQSIAESQRDPCFRDKRRMRLHEACAPRNSKLVVWWHDQSIISPGVVSNNLATNPQIRDGTRVRNQPSFLSVSTKIFVDFTKSFVYLEPPETDTT